MANDKDMEIIVGADIPKSTVQIEADLKKIKTEPLKVDVKLDLDHVKKLKEQLEEIAKEQEKLQGYTKSKVDIKTTNTGAIDTASIKYYNELTKETVTQLYVIDKETGELALKTKDLVTDYQAQAKAEQTINKQRLDFINNQSISLDKLKSSYADNNALKSLDGDNLIQLNSVYDGIIAKTEQLKTADKIRSEQLQREIKAEIASYEQLIKSKQNSQYVATSLRTKDVFTINAEEVNNLKKFEAQIQNSRVGTNAMESDLKDLHTTLSTAFDKESLTAYLNQLSVVKSKFSALKEETKIKITDDSSNLQNQTKYYNKIKQELITIQKLKKQLANAGTEESVEINKQINNARKGISYDEQQIEKKKLYNQELFKEVNELKLIQEAENKIASAKQNDKVANEYLKQANSLEQIGVKAQVGINRLKIFENQLKSTAKAKYADDIIRIRNAFANVTDKKSLDSANLQLREFETNMKSMGNVGNTVFSKLTKNIGQFFSFMGAATIGMTVINSIRGAINNVVELDKSLTDLRIATNGTYEDTAKLLSSYNQLGKQMGATTKEVADSADSWLRQNKTLAETNILVQDSMVLSKLGQIDSANATQYLTSATKGYNVAVKDTIGIVDKLTAVDIKSATSAGGLAEGMSKVSNLANMSGVSMDKLLGYLAVVGETTQKEMSEVGNSFNLGTVAA